MAAETELKQAEEKMTKAVLSAREEFSHVRTGRASPQILDRIQVDYYGSKTPLNQLAGISVPEARLLVISPYDKTALGAIEKAIIASDLGLNPSNDGTFIRLVFPALTEDRRRDLIKVVKERAEEGKVAVRNVRRHVIQELEKFQKEGDLSEDDLKRVEKELQKLTDHKVEEIEEMLAHKEKELLEV